MLPKQFQHLEFVDFESCPTILARDPKSQNFVIGSTAAALSRARRPIVQGFKQAIGESDPMFEGRLISSKGTPPQRRWPIRYDGTDAENYLSTKEATSAFLKAFLKKAENVSPQLIIGIPSIKDPNWAAQYRAHLSGVLCDLGYETPSFFPEPFAVFQYYRHVEELIPSTPQALSVLVLDIGGGTSDCCIIQTTSEGALSKSGSNAKPLGIQSSTRAGKEIDRRLLKRALKTSTDSRLRHESTDARIDSRPWVLLAVEQAKIALSQKMAGFNLAVDCREVREQIELPAGTYHSDASLSLVLTGNDLKSVMEEIWFERNGIGEAVIATVREARFREGELKLDYLDRVILAGGSARLPFLREFLNKTLAGQIRCDVENIVIGGHSEKAVAIGIAVEAAVQSERSHLLHSAIGPCVFSELHFYSALRRGEKARKPRIRLAGTADDQLPGHILSGPMQIGGFELSMEVELPFRPNGTLLYWFGDRGDLAHPEQERLNVEQDILRLPPKAQQTFTLKLSFDGDRGLITPLFQFGNTVLPGRPFSFGGLRIHQSVSAYTGLDFGTSNSYCVTLWGAPKQRQSKYPEFSLSNLVGSRLRDLDEKANVAKKRGKLNKSAISAIIEREQATFVFHSVKLEGNALSRGETEDLLAGKKLASSPESLEPINVRDAYRFALENSESLRQSPEAFIREINKIVLRDLTGQGGAYRRDDVKLAGMDFSPPDWTEVEPFMAQLAAEIRANDETKSPVHRAAEIHCKFTSIHPFKDGNGRTARLLMNAVLIEAGIPPVTIAHSDKNRYLDALATSNKGDISEFCVLLAESVETAIEDLNAPPVNKIPVMDAAADVEPPVKAWVPTQELAQLMSERIQRAPILRKNRYETWSAAFDSLREDFNSACLGFNDLYGRVLKTNLSRFDNLSYEKYEALLMRKHVTRTWLMGLEMSTELRSERFVFWFHHLSSEFQAALTKGKPKKSSLPNLEVSLSISRRVEGTYRTLKDEPITLREIAYVGGEWISLLCMQSQSVEASPMNATAAANLFLRDAIAAYF